MQTLEIFKTENTQLYKLALGVAVFTIFTI